MDFIALPKIELHAHLSGSISPQTLHTIWSSSPKHSADLADPLLMLNPTQSYDINTFFPLFSKYIYALLTDAATIRQSTLSVLEDFERDGVVYLELRTTPRRVSDEVSAREYVGLVVDAIREFEARTDPTPRLHTRLILSVDRRHSLAQAKEVLALAKEFSSQQQPGKPAVVVGIDLCGDPAAKLDGEIDVFTLVMMKAREAGLGITVHCAETPASADPKELDVILDKWVPDRLGHVCHLTDEAKERIRELGRGVGLELCVSCNIKGKLVDCEFDGHHFGEWWKLSDGQAGVGGEGPRVSLGTDDVGVFGSPLSNEYRLVAEHFRLDRDAVCRLARDGVDSIFGGRTEKRRLWEIMWI